MPRSVNTVPATQPRNTRNRPTIRMEHRKRGCCGRMNYPSRSGDSSTETPLHKFCRNLLKACRIWIRELHDRPSWSAPHTPCRDHHMTSFAPPLFEFPLATRISPPVKLAIAIGLAALADVLFWSHRIGLSMVLFAALLFAAALLANHAWSDRRRTLIAAMIVIAGLIPVVEDLNFLSLLF